MNWLRTIISTSGVLESSFYTAVDPAEFYDWKFAGYIPKGTTLTKRLPKNDAFMHGLVVACVSIPNINDLESEKDGTFITAKDIQSNLEIRIGSVSSPTELAHKFLRLQRDYQKEMDQFKRLASSQKFLIEGKDPVKLYRIDDTNNLANLIDFGPLSTVRKNLSFAQKELIKTSLHKKGRAYELESLRRFENFLTTLDNKQLPIEPQHVEYAFKLANIEPVSSRKIEWDECFTKLSPDAKIKSDRIKCLAKKKWLQAAISIVK